MHGVIGAGVILSVMGGGVFTNVLAAPNAWPYSVLAPLFVCAGTEWLVPKSPVAFHSLGLLPVCIVLLRIQWMAWPSFWWRYDLAIARAGVATGARGAPPGCIVGWLAENGVIGVKMMTPGVRGTQYRSDGFCQPTLKRWVVSISSLP